MNNLSDNDLDELAAHLVDDGTISAAMAARERCRARGICSEPDCEQAIDGWCEECGAKLCAGCLDLHGLDGCAEAHAAAVSLAQWYALELAREGSGGDGEC